LSLDEDRMPVIVGVGEFTDRPTECAVALEPIELMMRALELAEADAAAGLLRHADTIDLVGLISWRYSDPVTALCERLGVSPARRTNASMGGDTPIRLIHEAAVRIANGEQSIALIVGGEALHSRQRAKKEGVRLGWTSPATAEDAFVFPDSELPVSSLSKALGVAEPSRIYPLFEMAAQAAWGQAPSSGNAESAELWGRYAQVASRNPYAWMKLTPDAQQIRTVSRENRLVNWPYCKLMTANPSVNQAAAVIVTSLGAARAHGVSEDKIIHIWGGAAANESSDYLARSRYDFSAAQAATLARAVEIAGGDARRFTQLELYSCFPIVPKLALRCLGLDAASHVPTVAGGLTFFGGPLNNYMTHAVAAMVRSLRDDQSDGGLGLLYANGGVLTKHHTLVISRNAPPAPIATQYSVQDKADSASERAPALCEEYSGPAGIETYTVVYGRDGEPIQGVVVVKTPEGMRSLARVSREDSESLNLLLSTERNAIGTHGHVRIDAFGKPTWRAGTASRPSQPRFCKVARDGHLTTVTINRPEAFNALDPATNAELADIFDEFASDPEQWVAILTGAGDRAFSAGNDLKYTAKALARGESIEVPLTGFAGLTNRWNLTKPVIAAVNGLALGGGFEVALACDLIIAADTAVFGLPEPKVGLAALAGGLLRLPLHIGMKQAMGLILTGRRISAEDARSLGLVNEIAPHADVLEIARRWAAEIMENSPLSVRASKEIVQRGLDEPSMAVAYEAQSRYPAVRALFRSEDVKEGPAAFAEKRPPVWKGR
jgi:acetyl-CoA C-acetyltransferase